jgi:predicted O-linked N-acetylglucosamine transferase (SPINDLY family)
MFKVWMELLKEVPGSVLWLMKLNDSAHINLTNSAIQNGVDPKRIVFASRVPRPEDHLARYRLANVFLDTYPYNGHTTTSDALLAGLPVISLCGQSFASRVATSLLFDVGLFDLSSYNFKQYYDKAFDIANSISTKESYQKLLNQQITNDHWPINLLQQSKSFESLMSDILL